MNRMYSRINFRGDIMNFNFKNKKRGCGCRPNNILKKIRFTEILGLMLSVIGAIIIVQILPLKIWLFVLGILFVILGCTLFKLF